jgi:hypothetical protein
MSAIPVGVLLYGGKQAFLIFHVIFNMWNLLSFGGLVHLLSIDGVHAVLFLLSPPNQPQRIWSNLFFPRQQGLPLWFLAALEPNTPTAPHSRWCLRPYMFQISVGTDCTQDHSWHVYRRYTWPYGNSHHLGCYSLLERLLQNMCLRDQTPEERRSTSGEGLRQHRLQTRAYISEASPL